MAASIFNIAKGALAHYARLGAANDALIAVPIETAGLEADATLLDFDTLAAVVAGATNEQTTMGRKTLTGVTVTVDDTNNRVDIDADDITWAAATGNPVSKVVICYDDDTTGGTDSNLIPLVLDDFAATPAGGNIVYQVAASGFARIS
jgi:hypothetical protein